MEGDGPIMGSPKRLGALVVGANLTAVDSTCVRLMGYDPLKVPYLEYASGLLGPVAQSHIVQRGETISSLADSFELLDHPAMELFRS